MTPDTDRTIENHGGEALPGCRTTERLGNPCLAAGDRLYVIGAQDGSFPALGWHVPGEMGGIWAHPVKLADGFAFAVEGVWLPPAEVFRVDPTRNTHVITLAHGMEIERSIWVPDGYPCAVVRLALQAASDRVVTLIFAVAFDLRPVWPEPEEWLAEPATLRVEYRADLGAWVCREPVRSWCAIAGSRTDRPIAWWSGGEDGPTPSVDTGGTWAFAQYQVHLRAGEGHEVEFVIGGDARGLEAAESGYRRVRGAARALREVKVRRVEAALARSRLEVPDRAITTAWDWLKANNDWLVRDVPGVGRGLGAGAADFVWWFGCDTAYAALGCLALSQPETAIETIDLVRELSLRSNGPCGRVMHEANTRGEVVHPGCTEETPLLASAAWEVFRWTGDRAFLERTYPFCRAGVLGWLLETRCREGELLPYGPGITEVEGMDLQCLDSAVYTVTALEALGGMASDLGDTATAERCGALAPRAQAELEDAFWMDEEALYGDMLATPTEMAERARRWIASAERLNLGTTYPALVQLLARATADPAPDVKRSWLLGYWIVLCPLLAGLTPASQAARALDRIEGPEFSGPYGMYLNAFARTHAMSINTGALAETELRYGRTAQGIARLRQLADVLPLHMPGAISEYLPDEGCFVQAWSGYGLAWPLVTQGFGLQPDAGRRCLHIEPHLPAAWRDASLRNVRMGDATIDLTWDGRAMAVAVSRPGWSVQSDSVPLRVEAPE